MVVVNEIEGGVIGMDRKILQELANGIVGSDKKMIICQRKVDK